MARGKQNRRSLSIRGTAFARLFKYCETRGIPIAQYVEAAVSEQLDTDEAPTYTDDVARTILDEHRNDCRRKYKTDARSRCARARLRAKRSDEIMRKAFG